MGELAVVLNSIGTVCMLTALLMPPKRIKTILFLSFLGNAIVATGYIVGGSGINGAISCYAGAVMTIINFMFQVKEAPIPKWLLGVYTLAFVGFNFAGGFSWLALLAIVACIFFVLSIAQNNGTGYRVFTLINVILWCTYDVLSKSYAGLIPHVTMLVFTLVGMLVHDRKTKQ